MAAVEPAALVDDPEEPPDVLDVRVGEREVVAAPVHPLAEPDGALGELGSRPLDHGAAFARERLEPVLLDLALRVEAQFLLDADLDPEALAVEAVLVALVVAAQRLVALEHVLERAAPRGVHGECLVRRDRSVDEAEPGPVGVQRAEGRERPLALPEIEDRTLECIVVGHARKLGEHLGQVYEAVLDAQQAVARDRATVADRASAAPPASGGGGSDDGRRRRRRRRTRVESVLARPERLLVADGFAQRREEGIVVETIGIDRVRFHRHVGGEGLVDRGRLLPRRGLLERRIGGRPVVVGA